MDGVVVTRVQSILVKSELAGLIVRDRYSVAVLDEQA